MERTPVKSSQIASIGHDPEGEVLEVEFVKGGIYQYKGVSESMHTLLMGAESVGTFFGKSIRGKYPTVKLPPEPAAEGQKVAQ